MTDANFQTAVNLWFSDELNATMTYGHISDWNTSAVTNMSKGIRKLPRIDFNGIFQWFKQASLNQDIGRWNVMVHGSWTKSAIQWGLEYIGYL